MAGKNWAGVVRPKHKTVKALVLGLVRYEGCISKLQICRWLNSRDLRYCKYALGCYANSRKRAFYGLTHYVDCKISFMQIRYAINKLVKEGLVWVKKQKWRDAWQHRGWDWMWIVRPVKASRPPSSPTSLSNTDFNYGIDYLQPLNIFNRILG